MLFLLLAVPAGAQEMPQFVDATPQDGFLTHYNFHLGTEKQFESDPRFQWNADFGGDIDVVRFGGGRGRINVLASYDVQLGNELQPFDPVFGTYTIDLRGGWRSGLLQAEVLFHHASVHLGDRPKEFGIAWNELGVEFTWRHASAANDVQVRGRASGLLSRFDVDYHGSFGGDVLVRHHVRPRVALIGGAFIERRLVAEHINGRSDQTGARAEAGVRLEGRAGALEFFVGAERRIDPDPFDLTTYSWAVFGLRVVGRD